MPSSRTSDSVSLFTKLLTAEWTRQKAPTGFDDAFARAKLLPEETLERILLDAGFEVWLSYFLTQRRAHEGKRSESFAIETLNSLDTQGQREVAAQIGSAPVHPTISAAKIKLLDKHRIRRAQVMRKKRVRQTATPATNQMQLESVETHSDLEQLQPSANTVRNRTMAIEASDEANTLSSQIPNDHDSTSTPPDQTVSHPRNDRLRTIFDHYMIDAIRKHGDRAAITMTFPFSHSMVSMGLYILPNTIQFIAMQLFGVHIHVDNGFRYILLGNGTRLRIQGALVMDRAQVHSIRPVLGPEVDGAVNGSPARKDEVKKGLDHTGCVSLQISSVPDDDGILSLTFGAAEGFTIKEKLFDEIPANASGMQC
jgi:hypothetical protein